MVDPNHCHVSEVTIPSDHAEAREFQSQIEAVLLRFQYDDHDIFGIKLALEEALVNAIKHGNQMDRSKKVWIAYRIHRERVEIQISDEGVGFKPEDVPDPTAPENLERPCGRGVMLMRHYMTEVSYNERGNHVSMTKLRNGRA